MTGADFMDGLPQHHQRNPRQSDNPDGGLTPFPFDFFEQKPEPDEPRKGEEIGDENHTGFYSRAMRPATLYTRLATKEL